MSADAVNTSRNHEFVDDYSKKLGVESAQNKQGKEEHGKEQRREKEEEFYSSALPSVSEPEGIVEEEQAHLLLQLTSRNNAKRNLGRSARRRYKKLKEIQKMEQRLLFSFSSSQSNSNSDCNNSNTKNVKATTSSNSASTSSVLPTDRNRTWPGVFEARKKLRHEEKNKLHSAIQVYDEDDEKGDGTPSSYNVSSNHSKKKELISQLGYIPGNLLRILTASSSINCNINNMLSSSSLNCLANILSNNLNHGTPVAVELYPIVIRDVYEGGKCGGRNGRSKKARVRKPSLNQQPQKIKNGARSQNLILSREVFPKDEIGDNSGSNNNSNNRNEKNSHPTDSKNVVIEPFPTIYWLTLPILRILVSKLELQHKNIEYETRLKNDGNAYRTMESAHQQYANKRFSLIQLSSSDEEFIINRKWNKTIFSCGKNAGNIVNATTQDCCDSFGNSNENPKNNLNNQIRGVAGIRNFKSVKCLHAHVAHYLSGCADNLVGLWTLQDIQKQITTEPKPLLTTTRVKEK